MAGRTKGAMVILWACTTFAIPGAAVHGLLTTSQEAKSSARRFQASDHELRAWAATSPLPVYPSASLAKRVAGVVVATIRIDPKGAVEAVEIVQSPDAATGRAVQDALMRWRFRAFASGGDGVLVFYFHIEGSNGAVLNPTQMREVTNPGSKTVARADEPPLKSISEAEFQDLFTRSKPLLIDIRDRETFAEGHANGAVNIPIGEVIARGPAELSMSRHIVVDCRDPFDVCAIPAHFFALLGFSQVSILRR